MKMPLLNLDKFLLIRSPAYSYKNFNEQFLREALKGDFFRSSIFFASQTFYNELKKRDFDYDQLADQAQLTLWKYLNRMCYRPLPYGLFSSYSAGSWTEEEVSGFVFTGEERLTVRPDFKVLADYVGSFNLQDVISLKYYTNNSLYPSGKNLRFINQTLTPNQKFTLAELKSSAALNQLLKFISIGRTKREIISFLTDAYQDEAIVTSYFDSLKKEQVITSALAPNVTGTNYGDRCYQLIKDQLAINEYRLKSFENELDSNKQHLPALKSLLAELDAVSPENSSYTLYNREIAGSLPAALKPVILSLVTQMDRLTADQDIVHMKPFKADFLNKYDQQEVPLMEVLDPGIGIGYENLASAFDPQAEDFIADVRVTPEKRPTARWGGVEKMIFKKWNNLKKGISDKISINSDDLATLPESKDTLPPGLSVLFKVVDEQIWVDHIAGVSGIEIIGRFGAENSAVQASLKAVCECEMEMNSDYVFAEIAFSPNDRSSNINQRGHFYRYEIPLLTHSTLEEEFIIRLDDLMVSLRGDKVYLRSKRLNRFILPRLSAAYNYQISTVAAFRFLCDLQFQGLKSNLSFSLQSMFPWLDYYPRVEMCGAVISVETWVLNEAQLKEIISGQNDFIKDLALPNLFSLMEGDNFLVFDASRESDLALFRKCLKNKKTATLTEYVFAENAVVHNQKGDPFSSQMVACVINGQKSYPAPEGILRKQGKIKVNVKRVFLPGEDWLYLKLYAHYSLMDEILIDLILPLIKKYKKMHPGFKWFFIRFQDPAHHLRLRFWSNATLSLTLLSDLSIALQPWVASGKITDVIQDSYKRELEKYSPILMNDVEWFFYQDSEYILSAFSALNKRRTSFKLSFAVNSSLKIIHNFIADKKECLEFLNAVLDNLSSEFNRSKDIVHQLDVKYRNFQKELILAQSSAIMEKNSEVLNQQLLEIRTKTLKWNKSDQNNLLINLVHMHINRVFERNPREYEYVIYHFMKKHQAYLNHRANGGF